MDYAIDIIHKILISSITVLFISNSIILFLRGKNNSARRILSYVMMLWAAVYAYRMAGFYIEIYPNSYSLFRVNVLIIGNYYISLMFLFPLQVLLPGWINWKRVLLLFLPILLVTGLYYTVLKLLHQVPEELETYDQLLNSIGHFNVWYRFIILLSNFIYMMIVLKWLYKYEKKYIHWKNENYSDLDYVDIAWMKGYGLLMTAIFLAYLAVQGLGGKMPVIIHSIVVILAFSYLFYKCLFYESPYPENFFKDGDEGDFKENSSIINSINPLQKIKEEDECTFENNINQYTIRFKKWMEEEKPYLYKDFKLTDVSRIIPLNRTYLSRIFNEDLGQNFSEVVRKYRVEYAKEIIAKDKDLPLYEVAKLCGFTSDVTFIRAFKQVTGITPTFYKANLTE